MEEVEREVHVLMPMEEGMLRLRQQVSMTAEVVEVVVEAVVATG